MPSNHTPPKGPVGAEAMVERGEPPLLALLAIAQHQIEGRHLALMAEAGFEDVRRAHNAVFANLPAEGQRLTALAESAGITKQAMAELVDDLEAKGYVEKVPDPTDGRAKLITWADRGLQVHERTMQIFAAIDEDISAGLGDDGLGELKGRLGAAIAALDAAG